uniref:Uncharacterized protein n=1 Tax=Triticum urartu TaxID=4572 RepID=A0A8R7JX70_TRIUA
MAAVAHRCSRVGCSCRAGQCSGGRQFRIVACICLVRKTLLPSFLSEGLEITAS